MAEDISFFMAFVAGLLSFLSPCVLPLIPSYLGILGGVGLGKTRLVSTALCFIFGFSVVFIALGLLVNTAFFFISGISMYINIAAGIIVILLGLNIFFDFLSFLNYEKRPLFGSAIQATGDKANSGEGTRSIRVMAAAFFAGAAFAAGWTPCIGPILTGILLLAGQSGKTGQAVFYLCLYSIGLGLPFFLAALFFDFFVKHGRQLKAHIRLIQRISGILLILIGIMILTGKYSALNGEIQAMVSRYILWAENKAFPLAAIARFLSWLQNF